MANRVASLVSNLRQFTLVPLFILGCVIELITCANAQTGAQLFEQGFDLYAQHRYSEAERAFSAGIEKGDAQADHIGLGHYYLAETMMALQRPSNDVLIHYKEAIRFAPQTKEGRDAQTKVQRLGSLDDCDRLAADLEDPDRPSNFPGVSMSAIDGVAAINACASANKAWPHERRIMYELGRAYQALKKDMESRKWFEAAAAAGSMRAMYFLGVFFEQGTTKDYATARDWYKKAMDAGSVDAIRRVAVMTEKGQGGPADPVSARRLHGSAAEKGDTIAMLLLGFMCESGKGGPVDYAEARRWYRKAADFGDPGAMYFLAKTYDKQGSSDRDYGEARRWYEKAAAAGSVSSMTRLGELYASGLGVPRNPELAKRWYQQAASARNPPAGRGGAAKQ